MRKLRLDRASVPYAVGLLAGAGVGCYLVIDVMVRGASPLVIPLVSVLYIVGSTIGLSVFWLFRKILTKKDQE